MISALEAQIRGQGRWGQSSVPGFSGGWAPGQVRGNLPEEGATLRPEPRAKARLAQHSLSRAEEKATGEARKMAGLSSEDPGPAWLTSLVRMESGRRGPQLGPGLTACGQ